MYEDAPVIPPGMWSDGCLWTLLLLQLLPPSASSANGCGFQIGTTSSKTCGHQRSSPAGSCLRSAACARCLPDTLLRSALLRLLRTTTSLLLSATEYQRRFQLSQAQRLPPPVTLLLGATASKLIYQSCNCSGNGQLSQPEESSRQKSAYTCSSPCCW